MGTETHKRHKKRRYSEEMKKEVVKLSQKVGLSKASEATGVSRASIAIWRKQPLTAKAIASHPKYQRFLKKNKTLQSENERLEIINDVLKKKLCHHLQRSPEEKSMILDAHSNNPNIPVVKLCEKMGVPRRTFYVWKKRGKEATSWSSPREKRKFFLKTHITEIFNESKGAYGAPRVHRALLQQGIQVSLNTVAKYMKELNFKAKA